MYYILIQKLLLIPRKVSYIEQVQKFLEKTSDKQKLIVIYGPTGAGKTDMSIEIAQMLDTEIISTDSRQIFRYMDIGTGKITPEETKGVRHHMIDILDPDEKFSMGDFVRGAEDIMKGLWKNDKIPMLVGGTGLYIDSLIFERNASHVDADEDLRAELDLLSNDELYARLQQIDPEYAQELHPNNRPYIERAVEVKILTGKSKRDFRAERKLRYDVLFLTPQAPDGTIYREWLYDRINRRVEMMFREGAEDEVKDLLKRGYTFEDFGMNSIGYREFNGYFEGEKSSQEVMDHIRQNSRNYAKRQITWFKRYEQFIDS